MPTNFRNVFLVDNTTFSDEYWEDTGGVFSIDTASYRLNTNKEKGKMSNETPEIKNMRVKEFMAINSQRNKDAEKLNKELNTLEKQGLQTVLDTVKQILSIMGEEFTAKIMDARKVRYTKDYFVPQSQQNITDNKHEQFLDAHFPFIRKKSYESVSNKMFTTLEGVAYFPRFDIVLEKSQDFINLKNYFLNLDHDFTVFSFCDFLQHGLKEHEREFIETDLHMKVEEFRILVLEALYTINEHSFCINNLDDITNRGSFFIEKNSTLESIYHRHYYLSEEGVVEVYARMFPSERKKFKEQLVKLDLGDREDITPQTKHLSTIKE